MKEDMRFHMGLFVFFWLLLIGLQTLSDAQSRLFFILTGGVAFYTGWIIGGKLKKH